MVKIACNTQKSLELDFLLFQFSAFFCILSGDRTPNTMATINWTEEFKPLIKKYKHTPHPLAFKNPYQLVIMVVLAAQDSDRNINKVTIPFFEEFPNFKALAAAEYDTVLQFISSVRSSRKKNKWIIEIAKAIRDEKSIPRTMEELTALPGVGRKSASVIMKELGAPAEGIIVDLHVVRVAPRIGVSSGSDPKKIEKQLMEALKKKYWGDVGMAISHLGREICRPTDPKHELCVMNHVCAYCNGAPTQSLSKKADTKRLTEAKGKEKSGKAVKKGIAKPNITPAKAVSKKR